MNTLKLLSLSFVFLALGQLCCADALQQEEAKTLETIEKKESCKKTEVMSVVSPEKASQVIEEEPDVDDGPDDDDDEAFSKFIKFAQKIKNGDIDQE